MKFIDEAVIEVKSGKGGPGAISFRREKFVPMGGPDGGHGGDGGSVIVFANRNNHTLLDFKYRTLWEAGNGAKGGMSGCEGKSAEDLYIPVPVGTQIIDFETRSVICDLTEDKQEIVIAKGGRGGKGNEFFKSATNQAPDYAQPGESGEHKKIILNLKLVADVGIIGFPNAGKSTFISCVSSAKPKIADYPFTTLTPNLGVAKLPAGGTVVLADVPGLIPGASEGKGLGIKFLKHIERCEILLHLIDPFAYGENGEPIEPFEAYKQINSELESFSNELGEKKQIVAITKMDAMPDKEAQKKIAKKFKVKPFFISSINKQGVEDLLKAIEKELVRARTVSL